MPESSSSASSPQHLLARQRPFNSLGFMICVTQPVRLRSAKFGTKCHKKELCAVHTDMSPCYLCLNSHREMEKQSSDPSSEIKSPLHAREPEELIVMIFHHEKALIEGLISGNLILPTAQRKCPSSVCLHSERDNTEADRRQQELDTTK